MNEKHFYLSLEVELYLHLRHKLFIFSTPNVPSIKNEVTFYISVRWFHLVPSGTISKPTLQGFQAIFEGQKKSDDICTYFQCILINISEDNINLNMPELLHLLHLICSNLDRQKSHRQSVDNSCTKEENCMKVKRRNFENKLLKN